MRSAVVSIAIMFASISLVASSSALLHPAPPAPGDSGDTSAAPDSGDTGADSGDSGGDSGDSGDTGGDTGDTGDSGVVPDPDSGDSGLVTEVVDSGEADLPGIAAADLAGEKGGFGCTTGLVGSTAAFGWTVVFVAAGLGRRRERV